MEYWVALLLTLAAGLFTAVGSIFAFFINKHNKEFLAFCYGFSAGAMLFVCIAELYPAAIDSLTSGLGQITALSICAVAFFSGVLICMAVHFIPINDKKFKMKGADVNHNLKRGAMFTAFAVALHNLPEGLATFVSAASGTKLAIPMVIAIALHNIPEGIAVSVPVFTATNSRKKAFFYSTLSGLAEPVGALLGLSILCPFLNESLIGAMLAFVCGIMIYLILHELLPQAQKNSQSYAVTGLVTGMLTMSLSLIFISMF